jgi:hypothetical protein
MRFCVDEIQGCAMISSANEFAKLRSSQVKEEYDRAAHEEASLEVWQDVIENYPELRK